MKGNRLEGKVAIITGAGRGMGAATARLFAEHGAAVVVNDLEAAAAEEVARELRGGGAKALAFACSVLDGPKVEQLVRTAIETFGRVDILVNNAGVLRPTRVEGISEEEWDFVVDVSLKGAFLCAKAVIAHMKRQGWGRIVNMSSSAGRSVSTLGGCHYTAAKAGLLGLSRALAKELAPFGVTVNAVCPGLIDTEMVRRTCPPERIAAYERSFPIPRLGRPEEVADLVLFLACDESSYSPGASLDINGGDLMI